VAHSGINNSLIAQRPHLKVMVLEPGRSGSRDSCSLVGVSVLRIMMMCFFLRLQTPKPHNQPSQHTQQIDEPAQRN
jgi:hypothetical protein